MENYKIIYDAPVRASILFKLSKENTNVKEIAQYIQQSYSNTKRHMRILKEAKYIKPLDSKEDKRHTIYSLDINGKQFLRYVGVKDDSRSN